MIFIYQPARLCSKRLRDRDSAAVAEDAQSEIWLSGSPFGDEIISLTVCAFTAFSRASEQREHWTSFGGSSKWSPLSVVASTILILISVQQWKGSFHYLGATQKKCVAQWEWTQAQDVSALATRKDERKYHKTIQAQIVYINKKKIKKNTLQ